MTPGQIGLVQSSFELVAPIADTAAGLFYGRLFELDPGLRPLFKGEIEEQGRKLMQTLAIVVRGLQDLESIAPAVRQLGERHVRYGVEEKHYEVVGAAFLWTLEKGLGEAYTPEVREAWTAAYGLLSSVMIEAGRTGRLRGNFQAAA